MQPCKLLRDFENKHNSKDAVPVPQCLIISQEHRWLKKYLFSRGYIPCYFRDVAHWTALSKTFNESPLGFAFPKKATAAQIATPGNLTAS